VWTSRAHGSGSRKLFRVICTYDQHTTASDVRGLLRKIKRGETPFYRVLWRIGYNLRSCAVPVPQMVRPPLRLAYGFLHAFAVALREARAYLFCTPLFTARCESVGRRLRVARLPFIVGNPQIHVGDCVNFYGKVSIHSGLILEDPTLKIGDRVVVGNGVTFCVNREIVLEDDVMIASGCTIADTDAHPRNPELRAQGLPPAAEDIKPIRICKKAWISAGCHIRKGVCIGEGAIVGVNSVVVNDVPANCIVMGNPARTVGFAGSPPKPAKESK
jgi:acetyltransferase-like isoleucine patch superfamily enzyme